MLDSAQNYELAFTHLKSSQFISAHTQFVNLAESMKKSDMLKSALLYVLAAECKAKQGKDTKNDFEQAGELFLKYGKSKNKPNSRGALLCASKCFLKLNEFNKAKEAYQHATSIPYEEAQLRPIIIIDDSKAIAKKLETYVSKLGYQQIHIFYNGKEAIKGAKEIISKNIRPIILLDMGLPDIDGDKVAKSILDSDVTLQIIVITADEKSTKRVHTTISSGVSGFIQKPFTIDELKKTIDTAESEYSLQQ